MAGVEITKVLAFPSDNVRSMVSKQVRASMLACCRNWLRVINLNTLVDHWIVTSKKMLTRTPASRISGNEKPLSCRRVVRPLADRFFMVLSACHGGFLSHGI